MECNKGEAMRAKEIAEIKFAEKDFAAAKKFAIKAQTLYPGLEDLAQMLETFDMHLRTENTDGKADYYGVLGVTSSANDDAIKRRYRKLALMLHPDKNKSVGAEGAFKIVSEAWSVLSDKSRRELYDQKRIPQVSRQKATPTDQQQTAPSGANGFHNSGKQTAPMDSGNKNTSSTNNSSQKKKLDTFWTVCHICSTRHQYVRMYLNRNLVCSKCRETFFAIEVPPPASVASKTSTPGATSQQQRPSNAKPARDETSASKRQDGGMKRKSYDQEKMPGVSSTEHLSSGKKKRYTEEFGVGSMGQSSMGFGISTAASSFGHGYSGPTKLNRINPLYGLRELPQVEVRSILMDKARRSISKKIDSYKTSSMLKQAASREKAQTEEKGMKHPDASDQGSSKTSESLSMSVPDPEFYDFDRDRTERSFEENQVWAGYDNDDGMPRFYGIIHSVLSRSPFKVQISWLNAKTNTKLGPLNWVSSGFSKTCGYFRPGKPEVSDSLNSFSHIVQWTKGARGAICIFPRKGDVWALYRNWSPDWDEFTPDDIIHKYDMVDVLEDYEEQQGVPVIPLVKAPGYKTVFRPHLDNSQIKRIPRGEMFRFSHQVPRHLLTDQEASGALKGCVELDPSATSADLLRVIDDARQDVDEAAKSEEGLVDGEMKPVDKDQRQNFSSSS